MRVAGGTFAPTRVGHPQEGPDPKDVKDGGGGAEFLKNIRKYTTVASSASKFPQFARGGPPNPPVKKWALQNSFFDTALPMDHVPMFLWWTLTHII